jgi:Glycosyl transferase family 2
VSSTPSVSIIIATYNRQAVLTEVLDVLRQQTFREWEAIVVGDACTDGTADAIARFADPRLRFVNMTRNHGEQSAPNNEGVRLARADRLAFLNHDDFWRLDHLECALAHLEQRGADLVYSWTANLLPEGTVVLLGPSPLGRYSPDVIVPASSWVLRRELATRVGPWRNGWTLRLTPSQDWLWRAARTGANLLELPRLSVLGLPSGARVRSYRTAGAAEHEMWRRRILSGDAWTEQLLTAYVHEQTQGGRLPSSRRAVRQLAAVARNVMTRQSARLGVHPLAVWMTLTHPGRGGFLRWLRRRRGLDDLGSGGSGEGFKQR